jgi:HPt (histidine-containing phosphotransfer) domain-containing protein
VTPAPTPPPVASDRVIDADVIETLKTLKSEQRTDPVGEMVSLFVRQAPACLQEIELSLTRYEARSVEKAAHSLKGSASTMGARRLAELCATLEEEARKGSLQVTAHLLNQARVEYLKAKEELLTLRQQG